MTETVEQRATRIVEYSKLGYGQHRAVIELQTAEHDGWMRGFHEHERIMDGVLRRLCIGWFAVGVGVGVALLAVVFRVTH